MKIRMSMKRKECEYLLTESYEEYEHSGSDERHKAEMLIMTVFFEIYDFMEGTCHTAIVRELYFNNKAGPTLEKVAQSVHADISTLRRYRKKYLKALLYILRHPKDSAVAKLVKILSNNKNNL